MKHHAHPLHKVSAVWLIAAVFTSLTLFATSLFASEGTLLTVTTSAVVFETSEIYEGFSLIVGGPAGKVHRETLENTQGLSFGLFDNEGNPRPDGLYSYQLRGRRTNGEAGARATEEEAPQTRQTLLDAGFFTLAEGAFVSPEVPEGQDFEKLILNNQDLDVDGDLIARQNTCLGFDCPTELSNYGHYNVRLRENNTRLMFEDTSSTASFPKNDWVLKANDHFNGGASYFSIQDCGEDGDCSSTNAVNPFTILSGAPENALLIDSDGDLGLGTAAPEVDIHAVDGNTPALRLEQDGSSGFDAQTWDVAGNEWNFFIRDITNDSALPFRIRAGAPDDALFIDVDGDVGLGTDKPLARLDVRGDVVLTGTVDGRDVAADGQVLDAHIADSGNPHGVTPAQIGAEPAGTATGAVANHEATYDHSGLGSDHLKVGIAHDTAFTGNPAIAVISFATPFPAGTNYALNITVVTGNNTQTPILANARNTSEHGFEIFLDGGITNLQRVDWIARRVN